MADAEDAARNSIAVARGSDLVLTTAEAQMVLGDVLDARGRGEDAAAAHEQAEAVLRAKRFDAALARL